LGAGDEMTEFVARTGTDGFTQVADLSGDLWLDFGALERSSFLFVDGESGELRRTFYGEMDEDTLRTFTESLVEQG